MNCIIQVASHIVLYRDTQAVSSNRLLLQRVFYNMRWTMFGLYMSLIDIFKNMVIPGQVLIREEK